MLTVNAKLAFLLEITTVCTRNRELNSYGISELNFDGSFHCLPQTLLKNYLFTLSYTRTFSTKWEKRSLEPWQRQTGWH